MRGEMKSLVPMSLLPKSFTDESHDVALGWRERFPPAGRSVALAATTLCVGDRLLSGQGSSFGPGRFKSLFSHGVSQRCQ